MRYQALALDLDGTTLTSQHTINPAIKAAIERIKQQACVILVTGRHHTAAHPYHHELGLNTPIICCNGTYVYDYRAQRILAENAIPHDDAKRFMALAREHQLNLVMYLTDRMVYAAHSPIRYMEALCQWASRFPDPIRPQIMKVGSLDAALAESRHVWKFVVEGEVAEVRAFAELPWVKAHFSGEQSWSNRIDFARHGNNKGARLNDYLQQQHIDPAQLIAIGDNHNDLSMLRLAGLGVAMANAEEAIRWQADCVTEQSNDGRGILDILLRHFPA
ncbi:MULTISPECIES: Cof-type HAD-IIB family hydrolase [Dickeya]|uniref:HMP-PP hydrolase (Pyridoxal phosphatase) Cof, detected in genetic screen for thiamin metabolic genes (PMID:15292217) n=1 Tax=Dickeya aquatica TaxID=1401087 RepID=A0A375AFU1_9GAMM|nr:MULTISPECIES: Cof-type HAD-IIB family hydrolase [Dickeya]SLM64857.1 HMP-PP hydrolase (pyridoxal phosphatase) Cof, detected in genetic screen for thiamin metabolic genes (PMID:15292217) [Dickeya aquatica]